jgi:hypothetical protein
VPQPTDLDFVQGAAAEQAVADDPFWAAVLRRHHDVDVVVLPQRPTADLVVPDGEPEIDPERAREVLRGQMAAFWAAIGLDAEPDHLDDTWFAGAATGTLRWQGTATFEGLDPVAASAALGQAREVLPEDAGWHVLAPADGIPRVLAGRDAELGREEVQVLLPASTRLVVRLRSPLVHVGPDAVAAVLGAGTEGGDL